ncbi:GNAT family N-acetyltransferase [Pseudoruegeria sp. SK021]|uniref:GNAT family N-acetyltransferase n=1 Tax=Pseudoruegeria sp. SK021 TaxID=1933035 RepID=UPI000A24FA1A|nr:GNAT family N-acetyltransferase [Pseudoruegeria sp. SK021]OSP55449.1 GNAT family N-acetyltransferase [Pseudoruegeria sp. SK021]
MTATLRPLTASDKDQWTALWRDYLEFYQATLPDSQFDLQFARLIGDDPRDFNGIVAEIDGQLVGIVHFVFHRHGWHAEDVCYLQDLYVAPVARATGQGRALIEAVYAAADAAGAANVYWLTQSFNTTARQLYDRVGRETPFLKYQRS